MIRETLSLGLCGQTPTYCLVKQHLAHSHTYRCHLDALVFADELERLLERQDPRWDQVDKLL
jgi:hypothetical protein